MIKILFPAKWSGKDDMRWLWSENGEKSPLRLENDECCWQLFSLTILAS